MDSQSLARRVVALIDSLPDSMSVLGKDAWEAIKKDVHENPPTEPARELLEGVARVIRVSVTYNDTGERFFSIAGTPSGGQAESWYRFTREVSDLASGRLWGALLDDLLVERAAESGLAGRARFDLAMRAAERYVSFAEHLRTSGTLNESTAMLAEDCLSRAAHIALGFKNADRAERVAAEVLLLGDALLSAGDFWTFVALSSVITKLASGRVNAGFTATDLDRVEQRLEQAAALFAKSSGHRAERALHALGQLRAARGDKEAPRLARLASAQALEQEAARRAASGSAMVAACLLSEAIRMRQDNGDAAGAEALRTQVRAYHRQAQEAGELTTTVTRLEVPREVLDEAAQLVLDCETQESALALLASRYTPTDAQVHRLRQSAENDISGLVSTVLIRGDLPSAAGATDAERQATAARVALWQEVFLRAEIFLEHVWGALVGAWPVDSQGLCDFLVAGGNIPDRSRAFLEAGAGHFLRGDYLSAICVWVPQVEAIVRMILALSGRSVTAFTTSAGGTFSEQTFGALLDDASSVLGEGMVEYLRCVLADRAGLNLRNDLAHGILDPETCTGTNARLVLHILLALSRVPRPPATGTATT